VEVVVTGLGLAAAAWATVGVALSIVTEADPWTDPDAA